MEEKIAALVHIADVGDITEALTKKIYTVTPVLVKDGDDREMGEITFTIMDRYASIEDIVRVKTERELTMRVLDVLYSVDHIVHEERKGNGEPIGVVDTIRDVFNTSRMGGKVVVVSHERNKIKETVLADVIWHNVDDYEDDVFVVARSTRIDNAGIVLLRIGDDRTYKLRRLTGQDEGRYYGVVATARAPYDVAHLKIV